MNYYDEIKNELINNEIIWKIQKYIEQIKMVVSCLRLKKIN